MKVGDVVVLKSGGPLMTVSEVDQELITCKWFDKQEMPHKDFFQPGTLKLSGD